MLLNMTMTILIILKMTTMMRMTSSINHQANKEQVGKEENTLKR